MDSSNVYDSGPLAGYRRVDFNNLVDRLDIINKQELAALRASEQYKKYVAKLPKPPPFSTPTPNVVQYISDRTQPIFDAAIKTVTDYQSDNTKPVPSDQDRYLASVALYFKAKSAGEKINYYSAYERVRNEGQYPIDISQKVTAPATVAPAITSTVNESALASRWMNTGAPTIETNKADVKPAAVANKATVSNAQMWPSSTLLDLYKTPDGKWDIYKYAQEQNDLGIKNSDIKAKLISMNPDDAAWVNQVNATMVLIPPDALASNASYISMSPLERMDYNAEHPNDPRVQNLNFYYDLAVKPNLESDGWKRMGLLFGGSAEQLVDMARLPTDSLGKSINKGLSQLGTESKDAIADGITIIPSISVGKLQQAKYGVGNKSNYDAQGTILDKAKNELGKWENKEQLREQITEFLSGLPDAGTQLGNKEISDLATGLADSVISFAKFLPSVPITLARSRVDLGKGDIGQAVARDAAFGAGLVLWPVQMLGGTSTSIGEGRPFEAIGSILGVGAALFVGPKAIALTSRELRNIVDPATVTQRARTIQVDLVRVTDSHASLAAMMDAVHQAEQAMVEASKTGKPVKEYYTGTNSGAIARARVSPNMIVDSTKGWHTTYVTNAQDELLAYRKNGETVLTAPERLETPTSQYNTGMGTGPAVSFLQGINPGEEPAIFNTWRSPEKLGKIPDKVKYQIFWDDVPAARDELLQQWLSGTLPEDVWWQVAKGFKARGEKFMSLELENTDPENVKFIPMPKDLVPEYAKYEWVDDTGKVLSDGHTKGELERARSKDSAVYQEVARELPYTYDVSPGRVVDTAGNVVRREGDRIKSYINATESYVEWARKNGIKPLTVKDAYRKELLSAGQTVADVLSGRYRLNTNFASGRDAVTTTSPFSSVAQTVKITAIKPNKYNWVQKTDSQGNPAGVIANLPVNLVVNRGRIMGEAVGAKYPAISVYVIDKANKRMLLAHGVDDPIPREGKYGYNETVWTNVGGAADWTNPERQALWELGNDQTSHEVNIDVQDPSRWHYIGFDEGTRKDFSQSGSPVYVLDVTGLNVNPNASGPKNPAVVPAGKQAKVFHANELTEQNPVPEIDAIAWWDIPNNRIEGVEGIASRSVSSIPFDVADYRHIEKIAKDYPELGIDMSRVKQFRGDENYSRQLLTKDEDANFASRSALPLAELNEKGLAYQRNLEKVAKSKSPEALATLKGMTYHPLAGSSQGAIRFGSEANIKISRMPKSAVLADMPKVKAIKILQKGSRGLDGLPDAEGLIAKLENGSANRQEIEDVAFRLGVKDSTRIADVERLWEREEALLKGAADRLPPVQDGYVRVVHSTSTEKAAKIAEEGFTYLGGIDHTSYVVLDDPRAIARAMSGYEGDAVVVLDIPKREYDKAVLGAKSTQIERGIPHDVEPTDINIRGTTGHMPSEFVRAVVSKRDGAIKIYGDAAIEFKGIELKLAPEAEAKINEVASRSERNQIPYRAELERPIRSITPQRREVAAVASRRDESVVSVRPEIIEGRRATLDDRGAERSIGRGEGMSRPEGRAERREESRTERLPSDGVRAPISPARVTPVATTVPVPPIIIRTKHGEVVATQEKLEGAVAWKQGIMYIAWVKPFTQRDILYTRKPIPGVKYFTGPGSAAKSIVATYGEVPDFLHAHMGVVDVNIKGQGRNQPILTFQEDKWVSHRHSVKPTKSSIISTGGLK
jgi:hypothetical protein